MTASKYIRSKGLPSLQYVADKINKHPSTLHDWYKNNFALFEAVVDGCVEDDVVKAVELIESVLKEVVRRKG